MNSTKSIQSNQHQEDLPNDGVVLKCYFCGNSFSKSKIENVCNNIKCIEKYKKHNLVKQKTDNVLTFSNKSIRRRDLENTLYNYICSDKNQSVLDDCFNFAENPLVSLVLSGPFGSGKTHLSIGTTRELIINQNLTSSEFKFISASEITRMIRLSRFKQFDYSELSRATLFPSAGPKCSSPILLI